MTGQKSAGTTLDTSVLIPALLPWHPHHDLARAGARRVRSIPAHVLLECYSVLTRLPDRLRLTTAAAAEAVTAVDLEPLGLPAGRQRDVIAALAAKGIGGGAVFDALIGATADEHGLTLLTLDRRASPTYEAVGAAYRQL